MCQAFSAGCYTFKYFCFLVPKMKRKSLLTLALSKCRKKRKRDRKRFADLDLSTDGDNCDHIPSLFVNVNGRSTREDNNQTPCSSDVNNSSLTDNVHCSVNTAIYQVYIVKLICCREIL